jgi:hypothetical protein
MSGDDIDHSEVAPCPNCRTPPETLLGTDGREVGECGNRNCSVLQYEVTRSVGADTDHEEGTDDE